MWDGLVSHGSLDKIFPLNLDVLLKDEPRRHVKLENLLVSLQLLSILTTFCKPFHSTPHSLYQLHLVLLQHCPSTVAQASSIL